MSRIGEVNRWLDINIQTAVAKQARRCRDPAGEPARVPLSKIKVLRA